VQPEERDTPRVQKLRRAWWRKVRKIEVKHLVFVDETGVNTAMTRTRARAAKGKRAVGKVPQGHWKTLTVLGALRLEGVAAAATIAAPTDAEVFRVFVRQALVPALRPDDVVVWDHLSSHQAAGVAEAIQEVGARLLPLPPYSSDYSPIEPCWSKVKQRRRAVEARAEEPLGQAAAKALASVSAADAQGWFENCGFCSQ
jgi:transposase